MRAESLAALDASVLDLEGRADRSEFLPVRERAVGNSAGLEYNAITKEYAAALMRAGDRPARPYLALGSERCGRCTFLCSRVLFSGFGGCPPLRRLAAKDAQEVGPRGRRARRSRADRIVCLSSRVSPRRGSGIPDALDHLSWRAGIRGFAAGSSVRCAASLLRVCGVGISRLFSFRTAVRRCRIAPGRGRSRPCVEDGIFGAIRRIVATAAVARIRSP
ncbi:hypothetical protein HPB47_020090 [Ixodes persulcatus]|uniref:Uncharacterized protein n=1 Tax=Ixodes persulcatus TaxID=34615 RepID=A0AC60QG94_IXOPE|nr:hypothetical protein HPB47_020090 [Ixodes persulcatus]